jgi:hypothetical protein
MYRLNDSESKRFIFLGKKRAVNAFRLEKARRSSLIGPNGAFSSAILKIADFQIPMDVLGLG